jgi:hypothetical protein
MRQIDFLLLCKAVLAAVAIIARIALALLVAHHRAATSAIHPPHTAERAASDTAPALRSDVISRSIGVALQLGQIVSAALTVLEWLHHAGLL